METTMDTRMAVARDQCRMGGHSLDVIMVTGSLAPRMVMCSNCGARWRINDSDRDQQFGYDASSAGMAE